VLRQPDRRVTNGQRRTDRNVASMSRSASVTRDKNYVYSFWGRRYLHIYTLYGMSMHLFDVAVKTDDNVKEISSLNCWELILTGIRRHCSVRKLVTNGCLALAAIVEADGKNACISFALNSWYSKCVHWLIQKRWKLKAYLMTYIHVFVALSAYRIKWSHLYF